MLEVTREMTLKIMREVCLSPLILKVRNYVRGEFEHLNLKCLLYITGQMVPVMGKWYRYLGKWYRYFSQLHLPGKLPDFPPPRILVRYRGFYDCAYDPSHRGIFKS